MFEWKERVVSIEEILGRPLNIYEQRYVPRSLYVAGKIPLPLKTPTVSVVGTRLPTHEAILYTDKLVRFLVERGVLVVSGLARGIDTAAHYAAIKNGGKTIAVLGTPLTRFYPPENRDLQLLIMREHLAISQFPPSHKTTSRDFIMRNRTMALISDASIIIEAGETSGALSQGWETLRLGRPLYISPRLLDGKLSWPEKMMKYGAKPLEDFDELFENLPSHEKEWITFFAK